jgi:hypothetical protein
MPIKADVFSSRARIQSCAPSRESNARSHEGSVGEMVSDAEFGMETLFDRLPTNLLCITNFVDRIQLSRQLLKDRQCPVRGPGHPTPHTWHRLLQQAWSSCGFRTTCLYPSSLFPYAPGFPGLLCCGKSHGSFDFQSGCPGKSL